MKFREECKECWKNDIWLQILTFASICLITASFIVPPLGIIESSVLAATGELAAFAAIWEFNKALNKNLDAKVKIKELEVEINRNEKNINDNNIIDSID